MGNVALEITEDFAELCDEDRLWVVLRCSPPVTVRLAEYFNDAGFTPIIMKLRRRPRSLKRFLAPIAAMPGYVFLEHRRLLTALDLMQRGVLPKFRVMKIMGITVLIRDVLLNPLRAIANDTAAEVMLARNYEGMDVTIKMPAFEGLVGLVVEQKPNECLVRMSSGTEIKIHPFLLAPVNV